MIVGIPKEIKNNEYRVSLPPGGARELTRRGHHVVVETNAGAGGGFSDDEYITAGATVDPTYFVDDVLHYGVANMPGAVPRTSSYALSNATLRYTINLASGALRDVLDGDPVLAKGLNVYRGEIVYPAVAQTFNMPLATMEAVV